MRVIDGITVFGEHDDQTIKQIKRCATHASVVGAALMADGHLGYSQPIGGVVAYRGAISPSGVGYDIGCIAGGTPVLTADGYALPIEEVAPQHAALCWDGARLRPIVPNFGAVPRGTRPVVRLRASDGRTLDATPDHRILTQDGWRAAGSLAIGERVASVYGQPRPVLATRARARTEPRVLVHDAIARAAPRWSVGNTVAAEIPGEIDWVPVESVERLAEPVPVFDVATGDPAESFLANGFVVHNCGNKAVRTPLRGEEVRPDIVPIMDRIFHEIPFGIGRAQAVKQEHDLFDDPTWRDVPRLKSLRQLAQQQLGTVGSGNHYVDIFVDEEGFVWVGVHFGSRGFGHRTASGFLNLAHGRAFGDRAPGESMDQPPTVLPLDSALGQDYVAAMRLAGRYAYAGRDAAVAQVLDILGTRATEAVHNHHNFGWLEEIGGEQLWVVRKGATPNRPGQRSFVGGSMGDASVILEGVESEENRLALGSTVHGAGRVMSRRRAAGKFDWKTGRHLGGEVSREMMLEWIRRVGVELRGAGTDESPHVYKRLPDVLAAHASTVRVVHTLRPIGVAMAGEDVVDPYKD